MENTMNSMPEMNEEELEEVSGGKISFKRRGDKAGYEQYQVVSGDTLIGIARKFNIRDWRKIRTWNPHINHDTNLIINGEWLYVKRNA